MIRKVQQINNKSKTLAVTIPKELEDKLGISKGTEVSLEVTGKTLHIKKAVIQIGRASCRERV